LNKGTSADKTCRQYQDERRTLIRKLKIRGADVKGKGGKIFKTKGWVLYRYVRATALRSEGIGWRKPQSSLKTSKWKGVKKAIITYETLLSTTGSITTRGRGKETPPRKKEKSRD